MKKKIHDVAQQEEILAGFMARANKLVPGRAVSDKFFGRVELVRAAKTTKKNPSGYGTRKFKLTDSKNAEAGTYTLGSLREALWAGIQQ